EPDPVQPGRGHSLPRAGPRIDPRVQGDGGRPGTQRHGPRHPRPWGRRRVRPAPRARDAKSATSRGIETLFAGTSGFSYATWKGKFYPASLPGAKMLRHYAERLNGVELNGSFYRTPPEATLRKWADVVPPVDLGSVAYFRLRRGYTNASLQPWVDVVRSAVATHEQVHVYFKHDSGSPALARRLLRHAARVPVRR